MMYAVSPGWRLWCTVPCPEFFLFASSGFSAGRRTGELALRSHSRFSSARREFSLFSALRICTWRKAQALLRPAFGTCAKKADVSSARMREEHRLGRGCAFWALKTIFPFMKREAKAEGEPKFLWQAASAPLCPAFAWPEAREGKPSRIHCFRR